MGSEKTIQQRIRILPVDDHSLFREGLSRLLETEPDFLLVATCATVSDALTVLKGAPVDVVPLDYGLRVEEGSTCLDEARRQRFKGRILMVTAGMGDAVTLRAFEG